MKNKFKNLNKNFLFSVLLFSMTPSKSMFKGDKEPDSKQPAPLMYQGELAPLDDAQTKNEFDWHHALYSQKFSLAYFENFCAYIQGSIDMIPTRRILIGASFLISAFLDCHPDGNAFNFMNDLMDSKFTILKTFDYNFIVDFIKNYSSTAIGNDIKMTLEDMDCDSKELDVEKKLEILCAGNNHTLADAFKVLVFYRELLLKNYNDKEIRPNFTSTIGPLLKKIKNIDQLIDSKSVVANVRNPTRGFEHPHQERTNDNNTYSIEGFSLNDIPSEKKNELFLTKAFEGIVLYRIQLVRNNIKIYLLSQMKKLGKPLYNENFQENKNYLLKK